jgi:hypothetical protein
MPYLIVATLLAQKSCHSYLCYDKFVLFEFEILIRGGIFHQKIVASLRSDCLSGNLSFKISGLRQAAINNTTAFLF